MDQYMDDLFKENSSSQKSIENKSLQFYENLKPEGYQYYWNQVWNEIIKDQLKNEVNIGLSYQVI